MFLVIAAYVGGRVAEFAAPYVRPEGRLLGLVAVGLFCSSVRASAKQAQMAWFRSRRSLYQGGMIVSGVMSASWVALMPPPGAGRGGLDGSGVPSGR